ncbi:MAG TPA: oxygenase MpaB family protein [Acidimicrobiales bacterium]|nr:oxygenase MpaB family protein [Acidimicrobiales bacterium]
MASLRAVLRPRDRPAGSHPAVARALLDHSSVYEDPWSRAARTTGYALRFGFGEDRDETATELRALHRGIGGVDDAGRRYHAWDRDVWTRVPSPPPSRSFAVDVMCSPWPRRDLETFYEGIRRIGLHYGLRSGSGRAC